MTDEEYDALVKKIALETHLGRVDPTLTAPSELESRYGTIAPSGTSLAAAIGSISGRPEASMAGATERPGVTGFTTPGLAAAVRSVTPDITTTAPVSMASRDIAPGIDEGINKLIDTQIQYHAKQYTEQEKAIPKALATLQDVDASDDARQAAQQVLSQPRVAPAYGALGNELKYNDLIKAIPNFEDIPKSDLDQQVTQLKRDAYVAALPPDKAMDILHGFSAQAGPSWRALQDLGIAHPGIAKSAYPGFAPTAPLFQPDIPSAQKPLATPASPAGPPRAIPVGPPSNAGLNIVRGTEFGEVDRPTRGGYTEPNWDVGARGAKLSGTDAEGVALPLDVLKNYGNTGDKDFIDNFNSKYDVQVVDPNTGKYVTAPLKDYGPGKSTGAGLDMLYATRQNLGLPENYSGQIGYRVVPKGSAPPANTTASVQQTAQQTSTTGGPVAAPDGNVYIQPIDRSKVKDPSKEGATMSNEDHLLYARSQADDYATAMAKAGTPLDTSQYQNIFSNFYTNSVKYKDLKPEDLKQPPQEYTDRFAALAGIVSPTGSTITDPDGKNPRPISQLDALLEHRNRARAPGALPGSDAGRLFDATKAQVIVPIARGLFGQKGNLSEGEQRNAEQGLPQWIDSDEAAKAKLDSVKAQIQDQMRTIINIGKAQHFDTSALEQEYRRIYVTGAAAARSDEQKKASKIQGKKELNALQQPPQAQPSPTPFTSTTNESVGTGWYGYGNQ
jgi:hypothetical protein